MSVHLFNMQCKQLCSVKLKDYLRFLDEVSSHDFIRCTKELIVRIGGDGRSMGHCRGSVMMCFTLVNREESGQTVSEIHTLALYRGDEKQFFLDKIVKDWMKTLNEEIEDLKKNGFITQNNTKLPVRCVLCADWKFLASILSLKTASANNFCLYCEHSKKSEDSMGTLRSLKRASQNKGKFGYVKSAPLLESVSWDYKGIIIDPLHLLLRCFDRLEWLLVRKLLILYKDPDQWKKAINRYCHLVEESCKVAKYNQAKSQKKKSVTFFPTLWGKQRLEVLRQMKFDHIFEVSNTNNRVESSDADQVPLDKAALSKQLTWLWNTLASIYKLLHNCGNSKKDAKLLTQSIKAWKKTFLETEPVLLFVAEDISPYLHVLFYHVPQLVKVWGSLAPFSCQGLEKTNHIQTLYYFRKTNRGPLAMMSIIQRELLLVMLTTQNG